MMIFWTILLLGSSLIGCSHGNDREYVLQEESRCIASTGLIYLNSEDDCVLAARSIGLADLEPTVLDEQSSISHSMPHGCYYKSSNVPKNQLWYNAGGHYEQNDTLRQSICGIRKSDAPYMKNDVGSCDAANGHFFISAADECLSAAIVLGFSEFQVQEISQDHVMAAGSPYGCYYKGSNREGSRLVFNAWGVEHLSSKERLSICRLSESRLDYLIHPGVCGGSLTYLETLKKCGAAAVQLGLKDTEPTPLESGSGLSEASPRRCYLKPTNRDDKQLWFNEGDGVEADSIRMSICQIQMSATETSNISNGNDVTDGADMRSVGVDEKGTANGQSVTVDTVNEQSEANKDSSKTHTSQVGEGNREVQDSVKNNAIDSEGISVATFDSSTGAAEPGVDIAGSIIADDASIVTPNVVEDEDISSSESLTADGDEHAFQTNSEAVRDVKDLSSENNGDPEGILETHEEDTLTAGAEIDVDQVENNSDQDVKSKSGQSSANSSVLDFNDETKAQSKDILVDSSVNRVSKLQAATAHEVADRDERVSADEHGDGSEQDKLGLVKDEVVRDDSTGSEPETVASMVSDENLEVGTSQSHAISNEVDVRVHPTGQDTEMEVIKELAEDQIQDSHAFDGDGNLGSTTPDKSLEYTENSETPHCETSDNDTSEGGKFDLDESCDDVSCKSDQHTSYTVAPVEDAAMVGLPYQDISIQKKSSMSVSGQKFKTWTMGSLLSAAEAQLKKYIKISPTSQTSVNFDGLELDPDSGISSKSTGLSKSSAEISEKLNLEQFELCIGSFSGDYMTGRILDAISDCQNTQNCVGFFIGMNTPGHSVYRLYKNLPLPSVPSPALTELGWKNQQCWRFMQEFTNDDGLSSSNTGSYNCDGDSCADEDSSEFFDPNEVSLGEPPNVPDYGDGESLESDVADGFELDTSDMNVEEVSLDNTELSEMPESDTFLSQDPQMLSKPGQEEHPLNSDDQDDTPEPGSSENTDVSQSVGMENFDGAEADSGSELTAKTDEEEVDMIQPEDGVVRFPFFWWTSSEDPVKEDKQTDVAKSPEESDVEEHQVDINEDELSEKTLEGGDSDEDRNEMDTTIQECDESEDCEIIYIEEFYDEEGAGSGGKTLDADVESNSFSLDTTLDETTSIHNNIDPGNTQSETQQQKDSERVVEPHNKDFVASQIPEDSNAKDLITDDIQLNDTLGKGGEAMYWNHFKSLLRSAPLTTKLEYLVAIAVLIAIRFLLLKRGKTVKIKSQAGESCDWLNRFLRENRPSFLNDQLQSAFLAKLEIGLKSSGRVKLQLNGLTINPTLFPTISNMVDSTDRNGNDILQFDADLVCEPGDLKITFRSPHDGTIYNYEIVMLKTSVTLKFLQSNIKQTIGVLSLKTHPKLKSLVSTSSSKSNRATTAAFHKRIDQLFLTMFTEPNNLQWILPKGITGKGFRSSKAVSSVSNTSKSDQKPAPDPRPTEKMTIHQRYGLDKHWRGRLFVQFGRGKKLRAMDFNGFSDPYCKLNIDVPSQKRQTGVREKTLNPVWNESYTFEVVGESRILNVEVWDFDTDAHDFIGHCSLFLSDLPMRSWTEQKFALLGKKGGFSKQSDSKRGKIYFNCYLGEEDETPPPFVGGTATSNRGSRVGSVAPSQRSGFVPQARINPIQSTPSHTPRKYLSLPNNSKLPHQMTPIHRFDQPASLPSSPLHIGRGREQIFHQISNGLSVVHERLDYDDNYALPPTTPSAHPTLRDPRPMSSMSHDREHARQNLVTPNAYVPLAPETEPKSSPMHRSGTNTVYDEEGFSVGGNGQPATQYNDEGFNTSQAPQAPRLSTKALKQHELGTRKLFSRNRKRNGNGDESVASSVVSNNSGSKVSFMRKIKNRLSKKNKSATPSDVGSQLSHGRKSKNYGNM